MTMPIKKTQVLTLLIFAALALAPAAGGSYVLDLVTKTMIYALLALSLELLVGGTGLVCFGQAAFFGVGAYAAALGAPADGSTPSLILLLALVSAPQRCSRWRSAR